MNPDMQLYYDYTVSPLGSLFYKTVWRQLDHIQGQNILDFGSGFGFTAQYMAQKNTVTAVEMDPGMLKVAASALISEPSSYTQICDCLSALKQFPDASFDVVICHLVLEFVDNGAEIVAELLRVLKKDGLLSVVRHNRAGRLIQAIVQEYDLPEAHKLLQGGHAYSSAFGDIKYYDNDEFLAMCAQPMRIEAVHGVRALSSLHSAQVQSQEGWLENMCALEWALLQNPHFVEIAYFQHLFLRKSS